MFSQLTRPPADPLWGLVAAHRADPRPDAMELVVGVYRDADGRTPVLDCVRAAEAILAAEGPSKVYRPLAGHPVFTAGMARLLLGPSPIRRARQATIQTVGGTGALRLLGDLAAGLNRRARVWTTSPGYVNHAPTFGAAGLGITTYRWSEVGGGLASTWSLKTLSTPRAAMSCCCMAVVTTPPGSTRPWNTGAPWPICAPSAV